MLGRSSLSLGLCVVSFGMLGPLLFRVVLDFRFRRLTSRRLSGLLGFCLPLHTASTTFSAITTSTRFPGFTRLARFTLASGCFSSRCVLGVFVSLSILRLSRVFLGYLLVQDFIDVCLDDADICDTTIFFVNMDMNVRIFLLVAFEAGFDMSGLFKGLLFLCLALLLQLCFAAKLLLTKFALSLLLNASAISLTTFAIFLFRLLDFLVILLRTGRRLAPFEGLNSLVLIGSAELFEIVVQLVRVVIHFDAESGNLVILQKRVTQLFSDLQ